MPRKDEIVQMLLDWEKCFNEAGAFMPRKGSPCWNRAGPPPCFNEAGAFMPRKARQVSSGGGLA